MAQSDRQRLLDTAYALPPASPHDFAGDRRPPDGADPSLLKRIDNTALRTKLVEARLAEGLQSPKGPQRIASIVRIYPDFDAPARDTNGRRKGPGKPSAAPVQPARGLPNVGQLERLIARYRDVEREVAAELASEADDRVARLKRTLGDLDGAELEAAHAELGSALAAKRALESQIRHETFTRIERDGDFAERVFLRFIARA